MCCGGGGGMREYTDDCAKAHEVLCLKLLMKVFYLIQFYSRAAGDAASAIKHFEESVEFLSKLPEKTHEVLCLKLL